MRIAHFSDPHLLDLTGARVRDWLNKRWLGGLNLLANRGRQHHTYVFEGLVAAINAQKVDHVLCTGDITNVSLPSEFQFARRLFDRFALGPKDVTVMAGNHDVYVPIGLRHFREAFQPYTQADPSFDFPDDDPWPVVRVRGPLALICVSTSVATGWGQAWGRIGEKQLQRLDALLADSRFSDKFRLVAVHHPPAGRRAESRVRGLRDHEAFGRIIAHRGADLILHGHEHEDLRAELPGPTRPVPVRGIQSATFEGKHDLMARFRIYDVAGPVAGKPSFTEELFVWRAAERDFIHDRQKQTS
jgi:3',5'-cyclic AMP phosphodiesterase CpdA